MARKKRGGSGGGGGETEEGRKMTEEPRGGVPGRGGGTEEGRGRTEEPPGGSEGGASLRLKVHSKQGGGTYYKGSLRGTLRYSQRTCAMYALLSLLSFTCRRGIAKLRLTWYCGHCSLLQFPSEQGLCELR